VERVTPGDRRPTDTLKPNPLNPRGPVDPAAPGIQEMADSIRQKGVLQPLLITPEGTIVAGHRRHAAATLAKEREVPVIVKHLTETEQQEIMLVENIQREDLTPLQEAQAFRALIERTGWTQADTARRLGVPHNRVHSRLVLLKLDPEVQERFHRGELPVTLADVLVDVKDPAHQRRLAAIAARKQITVLELRRVIDRAQGVVSSPPRRPPDDDQDAEPQGLSECRRNALERLEAEGDRTIAFSQLADVFKATCCACGMESEPSICSACPLAEYMARLAAIAA
jgi:ParB family chromosome partitioning protein